MWAGDEAGSDRGDNGVYFEVEDEESVARYRDYLNGLVEESVSRTWEQVSFTCLSPSPDNNMLKCGNRLLGGLTRAPIGPIALKPLRLSPTPTV